MTSATPLLRPGLPAVLIEAFTGVPCRGNGAGVVLLDQPVQAAWMQAIARSLRQSETAFLVPWQGEWLLRWFTPSCEVPLCGHATLAALLALSHWGLLGEGELTHVHTRSGALPMQGLRRPMADQAGMGLIELPGGELIPAAVPERLAHLLNNALGVAALRFWRSELGYAVTLLPADAPLATMPSLAPDLDDELGRGLVVMQATGSASARPEPEAASPGQDAAGDLEQQADYRLRFFAPALGIPEDPVTGSAHALVARWWQQQLGRSRVVGWQCSDRPGGLVSEGGPSGMIRLTGLGVLLWDGHLNAQPPVCAPGSDWPRPGSAV